MKHDYHIIVIGAGSAGLVVASGAAGLGANVALIEGHKMGGDCLNYGCIPSKALLKPAHLAAEIKNAAELGLLDATSKPKMENVMQRVKSVIAEIEPHDSKDRYEGLGVTVLEGYGTFLDKHTLKVGNKTITGKYIVIATGSTAIVPPIPGIKDIDYLTNHNFFDLKETPKHLIVLGAGPIGLELGQAMSHLGSKVTIIDMLPALFTKDEPEAGPIMEKILKKEGVTLHLGSAIKELKKRPNGEVSIIIEKDGTLQEITGDKVLLSLGRRPVTDTLNLEAAGVKTTEKGYIPTDNRLRSNIKHIYAAGDVVGPFQFTHMAGYQAGIVIKNTVLKIPAKLNYNAVPWVTYTKPELAHVGYTSQMAESENIDYDTIKIDLNTIDRAKADHDRHGFLKLVFTKRKSRLIGATIMGEKAGEMISLATLAIQQKQKVTTFMSLIFPYPVQSEIYKFASLKVAKRALKPWMKTLIQKLI